MSDYNKLLKFASLLGIKVRLVKKAKRGNAGAFWYSDFKPVIEIYVGKQDSKIELTLTLLHELGHAWDYIDLGRPKVSEIPDCLSGGKKQSRAERRTVYEFELRAIRKMKEIYLLLNLKLPVWRLEQERRFDLWISQRYLSAGVYPSLPIRVRFRKKLRKILNKKTMSSLSLI